MALLAVNYVVRCCSDKLFCTLLIVMTLNLPLLSFFISVRGEQFSSKVHNIYILFKVPYRNCLFFVD